MFPMKKNAKTSCVFVTPICSGVEKQGGTRMNIPKQLQNKKFRFVKLIERQKGAFEKDWQNTRNYTFNDESLRQHRGNLGIIGGFGNIRMIDVDKPELYEKFKLDTFTVKTGSGGYHIYIESDYDTNHVFVGRVGEFRANKYQCVVPPSVHPNGNSYTVYLDKPIKKMSYAAVYEHIKNYIRDTSRSGEEFRKVCQLIRKGLTKDQIFDVMNEYEKWANAHPQYRELTYNKALERTPPNSTSLHPTQPTPPNSTLTENEYIIQGLLQNTVPQIHQIKFGIHDGVFYYAITLFSKHENKIFTGIITDSGKIFVDLGKDNNQISKEFGLFYKYDFEHEMLDNYFSIDGVKRFRDGERHSLKTLYDQIVAINKKYMYYVDEEYHLTVALDIIASYFLPCFQTFGRSFLESEKGSGKTKQCTIYKKLCCNSLMSNDTSKAAFFRIMESTCGTLIIDDFDSISDDQKNDVLQHYKTGYKNSSKTIRAGDSKSRKLDSFRNYGHVVMNNTSGLDDISSDRSKFLRLLKTDKPQTNYNINENDSFWKELSQKLYMCGLSEWKSVQKQYDGLKSSLKARELEVMRPILSIAKIISDELFEQLESFWKDKFRENKMTDNQTDWNYLAVTYFETNNFYDLNVKGTDITKYILEQCYSDDKTKEKHRHGISIFIGKVFNNLPIIEKNTIQGANHYKVKNKKKYLEYLNVKGWSSKSNSTLSSTKTSSRVESGGVWWSQNKVELLDKNAKNFLAEIQRTFNVVTKDSTDGGWLFDKKDVDTMVQDPKHLEFLLNNGLEHRTKDKYFMEFQTFDQIMKKTRGRT